MDIALSGNPLHYLPMGVLLSRTTMGKWLIESGVSTAGLWEGCRRKGRHSKPLLLSAASSQETYLYGYHSIHEVRVRPSSPLRLYPGSVNKWSEGTPLTSLIGPWYVVIIMMVVYMRFTPNMVYTYVNYFCLLFFTLSMHLTNLPLPLIPSSSSRYVGLDVRHQFPDIHMICLLLPGCHPLACTRQTKSNSTVVVLLEASGYAFVGTVEHVWATTALHTVPKPCLTHDLALFTTRKC